LYALVDPGHKSAFDLLLKEAWNPEVAAMGNSTLPTVLDKLNVMSTTHLRKLIATLVRENGQRDAVIDKLEERIGVVESRLDEMKKQPSSRMFPCDCWFLVFAFPASSAATICFIAAVALVLSTTNLTRSLIDFINEANTHV
jgi:hypothetical protein